MLHFHTKRSSLNSLNVGSALYKLQIRCQSTKPFSVRQNSRTSTTTNSNTTNKNKNDATSAKFNALSNKNILRSTPGSGTSSSKAVRVKKDYSSTVPKVPHSTYLSPMHIKLDCLYALHRPLMMAGFKDDLLPLNTEMLEQSRLEHPSTFYPDGRRDVKDETSKKFKIDQVSFETDLLTIDSLLSTVGRTRKIGNDTTIIEPFDDKNEKLTLLDINDIDMEEVREDERGWERTPFAISAVGMRDFKEWDGVPVGKVIRAVDGRILPFQRPDKTGKVNIVEEKSKNSKKESELRVKNDRDFYRVEELRSNPAQKSELLKKTKGRLRPLPVTFKKKV